MRLVVLAVVGLLVGQVVVGAPDAAAVERRWTGGGSSDRWSDRANWSDQLLPLASDAVVFPWDAARAATVNDLAPGMVYSALVLGWGHRLSGNPVSVGAAPGTGLGHLSVDRDALVAVPLSLRSPTLLSGPYEGVGRVSESVDLAGHVVTVGPFRGELRFMAAVEGGGTISVVPDRFVGAVSWPRLVFEGRVGADLVMEAGTVVLGGGAGAVRQGGGVLAGHGTISSLHAAGGEVDARGGRLDVAGDVHLGDGSILGGHIGGADGTKLRVGGRVVLDNPRLQLSVAPDLATGEELTIIDNAGIEPIEGTFASLVEGSLIGQQFGTDGASVALALSYRGGDGNDVTATVVRAGYHVVFDSATTFTYGRVPAPGVIQASHTVTGAAADNDNFWVATAAGEVIARSGSSHHGDARSLPLNGSIVGMAASPAGSGYWLVAADGGVFAYGDARFHGAGQIGGTAAIAATPAGSGYWLIRHSGWIDPFGDAPQLGSPGGFLHDSQVAAIVAES